MRPGQSTGGHPTYAPEKGCFANPRYFGCYNSWVLLAPGGWRLGCYSTLIHRMTLPTKTHTAPVSKPKVEKPWIRDTMYCNPGWLPHPTWMLRGLWTAILWRRSRFQGELCNMILTQMCLTRLQLQTSWAVF